MTYQRKCRDWLTTFKDWTINRCEAPESFIIWAGIYALAAATRRNVKIGKKYLGGWECPPHLYVMFVGPPGGPRKTTTANFAVELLAKITAVTKGPDIVTQAALLTKLVESPDNSVYIIAEEFSDLIMKSGNDMYAFLTSMFDGKKSVEATTISRGAEFATKPCINMLAATTPVWISSNMTEDIIGGGFASRVIFVFEDKARTRQLFHRGNFDYENLPKLEADLISDLAHIATIEGDFDIEPEAEKFMEDWYREYVDKPRDKKVQGYFNRRHTHALKVAQLMHLSYSDDLTLNITDFQMALSVLGQIERRLDQVFLGIGKNAHVFDLQDIVKYVAENGKVKKSDLLRTFESAATSDKLLMLLEGLVIARRVRAIAEEGEVYYVSA